MNYSADGFALTKHFEGLRLNAYQDAVGVWTIGYGHTGQDVQAGDQVSEAAAELLLERDIIRTVNAVNGLVYVLLAQGQFDACVDFTFNLGIAHFQESTLLRMINANLMDRAALEFMRWIYAGGKVLPGLILRREAETKIFEGKPWQ